MKDLSRVVVFFLLATVVIAGPALAQCPMCKTALDGEGSQVAGLARGYFWSTILLVSAIPISLSVLGGVVWSSYRKARSLEPHPDRSRKPLP